MFEHPGEGSSFRDGVDLEASEAGAERSNDLFEKGETLGRRGGKVSGETRLCVVTFLVGGAFKPHPGGGIGKIPPLIFVFSQ